MQELGVCSNCPRDRATEEIVLRLCDLVDIFFVNLGCTLRQMKFQCVAVLERFVDDQSILAIHLISLKS